MPLFCWFGPKVYIIVIIVIIIIIIIIGFQLENNILIDFYVKWRGRCRSWQIFKKTVTQKISIALINVALID